MSCTLQSLFVAEWHTVEEKAWHYTTRTNTWHSHNRIVNLAQPHHRGKTQHSIDMQPTMLYAAYSCHTRGVRRRRKLQQGTAEEIRWETIHMMMSG